MLDWLGRSSPTPTVRLGGRELPLVVRRLSAARRMSLRLARDGSAVRVTMPRWGRDGEALAFAKARADWLEAQLARIAPPQPPAPGGVLRYRSEALAIIHDPAAPRRIVSEGGMVRLGGPVAAVPARLKRWLMAAARAHFAADLVDFAARAGVPPPTMALSSARARWGSCSAGGVVRLNWRLIMAPDFVRRSVVAHEVAHLVHFDHSQRFHALLGALFTDEPATIADANAWLKAEGRGLYVAFG